jgi:transcriptional regulator with XRE-family HTH domain
MVPATTTPAFRRVAVRLRQLRQARGVTLETLAERSEVPLDTIGRIERMVSCPSLRTLERIAGGLGVDVAMLVTESGRTHAHVVDPGDSESPEVVRILDLLAGRDPAELARVRRMLAAYFEE